MVTDFGLARSRETGDDAPTALSIAGGILGTPAYMPPEQVKGGEVTAAADLYSLGVVMYEMVTGKLPFTGDTALAIAIKRLEEAPPSPRTHVPDLDPQWETTILRCLARNPTDRYASVADVVEALREEKGLAALPIPPMRPRRGPVWLHLLLLAILLGAGVSLVAPSILRQLPGRHRSVPLPAEKQLAILPFTNVGNDPANQAFCDGLVEILSSKLSQLEQFQRTLQVVPASEVRREGIASAREARQVFGATLVITGSMQRTENRVRLTVNLVDPQTLRQLKSKTIDSELHDISVLQDGVVLEVAELLDVKLSGEAKQLLSAGGTSVPDAYDFYMQGKGYLQRYEDPRNVDTAMGLFQRALEQDRQYALAYAGLGEAYWRKYDRTKDPQWAELAKKSCATAIGLNDKLAQVYVTLGMVHTGTGQYEEAIRNVQRALDLDPINPDAYGELAKAYEALNNLKEAESTYRKAIAARPSFWGAHHEVGRFYFRFGRYAEAEKEFFKVMELTPDNWRAYNGLGAVYYTQKRYDEAIKMFEKSAAIKPTDTAYSNLGAIYFYLGRYPEAIRNVERSTRMNPRDSGRWYNLAAAYYWSNEREKARAAFQRAAELAEEQRRINPRNPALLMRLADCYSMLDQPQRARDLLREALALGPEDVANMYKAAVVYEQLGDREHALQWIAKAIQGGYSRDLIERSPTLAKLRADPRFQGLRSP